MSKLVRDIVSDTRVHVRDKIVHSHIECLQSLGIFEAGALAWTLILSALLLYSEYNVPPATLKADCLYFSQETTNLCRLRLRDAIYL
jgi:hypothetical protein